MHLPSPVPRLCGSEPCDQGSNPGSGSAMGHVLALSNRKTAEVNSLEPLPPGAGGARWCQFPAALVPAVLATLMSYCSRPQLCSRPNHQQFLAGHQVSQGHSTAHRPPARDRLGRPKPLQLAENTLNCLEISCM